MQNVPVEYAIGKTWKTRFDYATERGQKGVVMMDFRIAARESIVIPAGTFNAFKIEGRGFAVGEWGSAQYRIDIWRDPDKLRAAIVSDERSEQRGRITRAAGTELVSYNKEG